MFSLGGKIYQRGRLTCKQQVRRLSLHEYQSQGLLRDYDIPVPRQQLAKTPQEVEKAASEIGGKCVIKSQILKGGRGKGTFDNGLKGGIQIVDNPESASKIAGQMLGHRLSTKQTGDTGYLVNKLLVTESVKYEQEWYLAMTIDRENYSPALIISKTGGVDIETTAKETPEKLHTFHFQLTKGITAQLVDQITAQLGLSSRETTNLASILHRMHKVFVEKDANLLEINPLVLTKEGDFICLDAKFKFDDAAEPRQKSLFAMREPDEGEMDVAEEEAKKSGLVYIRLDGNIGNVVNGAGLAMATNDAIAFYGGASANFLDAGGQATQQTMQDAFEIILRDDRVKTILVNIYGGIIKCDMIARSIMAAAKAFGEFPVPVVVRLQGTNSALGLKLIEEANLGLHAVADFGDAANKAVQLAASS